MVYFPYPVSRNFSGGNHGMAPITSVRDENLKFVREVRTIAEDFTGTMKTMPSRMAVAEKKQASLGKT